MCIRSIGKVEEYGMTTRERPFLPPEEAGAEILKLHRQVGGLENEVMRLEAKVGDLLKKNGALFSRNGDLEAVIKTLCRNYCAPRRGGSCDLQCPGRDYGDTGGLSSVIMNLGKRREGQGG